MDKSADRTQLGMVMGEMSIIRELLSDHIEQTRDERAAMKVELNEIKTEITKYKFFFRSVVATAIAVATFQWGDISALWQ
jgi:hypothetical protein